MKNKQNSEDINHYYEVVNNIIDRYISKNKIKPSRLKKYLSSSKIDKLIEKNNLKDVFSIKRIFLDVIDDFVYMEKDGVMKFEHYKLFESDDIKIGSIKECLYKNIPKSDIKHEKAIADMLDLSLGHIEVVDSDKHIFNANGKKVIIYTNDEIDLIRDNIIEYCYIILCSRSIEIIDSVKIDLGNLIDKKSYIDKLNDLFSNEYTKKIIHGLLKDNYSQNKEYKGYHIWIMSESNTVR